MSSPRFIAVAGLIGVLAALLALLACACRRSVGRAAPELPERAAGWTAAVATRSYDPTTVYEYIDGHAEVYLAYGMRSCLSRRYQGPAGEPEIILDLFEMPAPGDAFGVFSHHRQGETIDVGQGATLAHGWLSAWRDRYYVSATADRSTPAARSALLELARDTVAQLPEGGSLPELVRVLPENGLRSDTVVYLRHPLILQSHLDLGPGNPLRTTADTPTVVARYVSADSEPRVLVARYGAGPAAERALEGAAQALGAGDLSRGAVNTDRYGWIDAGCIGPHLVVVVDADSTEAARELFEAVTGRLS